MFLPDEDEEDGLGDVWGVIDIDSTELGTFDEVDAEYLERMAGVLVESLESACGAVESSPLGG